MNSAPRVSSVAAAPPAPAPGRVQGTSAAGVGWVVLDNPARHNALSLDMGRQLAEALQGFAVDPAVRCVVIRGQGESAFCAGADLGEKQGVGADQARRDTELSLSHLRAIREFAKPLLAMINGYCMGAGMAIAVSCDVRIAATGSVLAIPAARLGLAYHYELIKLLTDLIGPARAKQMLFTADRLTCERALSIGLVDEVVAPDELRAFTTSMAERIAGNAPLTLAAAKRSIDNVMSESPELDAEAAEAQAWACLASEDYVEGRLAFREKRPPVFRGR